MIMRKGKKIIFASISVILSLVVADLLLNAAAIVSPHVNEVLSVIPKYIPDERLGNRPNPAYPEHDKNGFRNPQVPETAYMVALGDSQTYGAGAKAEHAWPRALEALTGWSVYNIAFGGFGPVHSLMLWDEASALKPKIVIEAMYSGNDLYDTYSMVYLRGKMPQLKTDDKSLLNAIAQAEESEPITKRVRKAGKSGRTISRFKQFRKSVKSWFAENSKIYALYWRIKYELSRIGEKDEDDEDRWKKAESSAAKHPEKFQAFSSKSSRTILASAYRLSALNLQDPRIREGQRMALEAINQLYQLTSRDGIRFIVLLIPTKELVFSQQAKGITAPNYHALIQNELQLWQETKLFLEEHSIEYIDALQALQTELESGFQPYQITKDGHPNQHGYRAIAGAINSYLTPDEQ